MQRCYKKPAPINGTEKEKKQNKAGVICAYKTDFKLLKVR